MKTKVSFLHTSPAAIPPLMQYYGAEAPDLEITNLLDDGILRFFRAGDEAASEARLRDLLAVARTIYRAEAVLVTCSAVSRGLVERLRGAAGVPLLKIDDPMAEQAVRTGRRIGVMVTFPPTLETTSRLLEEAARQAGVAVILEPLVTPEAYDALLGGDPDRHDQLLIGGLDRLAAGGVDCLVLAQVSMARILPKIQGRYPMPVLSSLPASLAALRQAMTSAAGASAPSQEPSGAASRRGGTPAAP